MRVHVPAFSADVRPVVARMAADPHPAYLRLGRGREARGISCCPTTRRGAALLTGETGVLVVVGPGAGGLLGAAMALDEADRPEIWIATELPFRVDTVPQAMLDRIAGTGALFVLEEHVAAWRRRPDAGPHPAGSAACIRAGSRHFHATGYPSGRYGSQVFHRVESGIDPASVLAATGRRAAA